jgi:methyl-accepting chemotaxis protein
MTLHKSPPREPGTASAALTGEVIAFPGRGARVDARVRQALQAMDDIARSSAEIDGALGALDQIITQIGLLATGAEAHAARTGGLGQDFAAVVAEVQGLAQRSASAAEEIRALARGAPQKMGAGGFAAQTAPAIHALAVEAAALSELMSKAGLAGPRPSETSRSR